MLSSFARPKSRRLRSRFSAEGNKARDKKRWHEAAAQYRKHLLLMPDDAPIWVQFGHVLKEGGMVAEAVTAYTTALDLDADNHEILLHLGHALLRSGDADKGISRIRESALAGNVNAAQDLLNLVGEHIRVPGRKGKDLSPASSHLLDKLSNYEHGLIAVDSSDIRILPDGHVKTLSNDPWILFEREDRKVAAGSIALLTIETQGYDTEVEPVGQIYADLGGGFTERNSTRFSFAGGKAYILLIEPKEIVSLRFDPDQEVNTLALPRLSINVFSDFDEIEQLVRNQAPESVDLELLLQMLANTYAGGREKPLPPSNVLALDFTLGSAISFSHDYEYWISRNATPDAADYERMRNIEAQFPLRPHFSFVMPTYNTPVALLRECLDSLLNQTYQDFEICIADDNSPNPDVVNTLDEYARKDSRVRFARRDFNGHISAASNTALSLAKGDFVVLVDHDDLVPDYALFVLAWYINQNPHADIFFSDEDKVTASGHRVQPYFKSEFNKYLLYGHNMVSHLGVYRRELIERVGGFRLGLEGSQDYDLVLRCFEHCSEDRVVHIPHILYHWRIIPGSTAMSADQKGYAVIAAQNAINGHFERQGMPLRSVDGFAPGCTGVKPSRNFDTPVSIIIPTRNGHEILKPCVESIFSRDRSNCEIIIIDNGSDDDASLSYLEKLSRLPDVRVIRDPGDFNFSRINNMAVENAQGDILCFLNNDTEVLSRDWLNRARTFLSMDEVGMVGARLLFPDGTLQHFGIALGMGEHRVAGTPHLGLDGQLPGYFGKARLLQEVSAVTAACMFMRKTDFQSVGGFDEELRVAYNDVDLCLKIRAMGLKILADPDITLIHKESRTRGSDKNGARAQRLSEEADWMRKRWAQELDNDPYFSPNVDLGRVDFGYAAKSRRPWPWESAGEPSL